MVTDAWRRRGSGVFSLKLCKFLQKTGAVLNTKYGNPQIAGQRFCGVTFRINDTLEEAWRIDFDPSELV